MDHLYAVPAREYLPHEGGPAAAKARRAGEPTEIGGADADVRGFFGGEDRFRKFKERGINAVRSAENFLGEFYSLRLRVFPVLFVRGKAARLRGVDPLQQKARRSGGAGFAEPLKQLRRYVFLVGSLVRRDPELFRQLFGNAVRAAKKGEIAADIAQYRVVCSHAAPAAAVA
ncbi:hypothetical protein SDC9_84737 [bioreactor metagenome]|uniref:Uncharacterized protein n=1 Tax=bioreactor metagenome TaxID=1076179 RepID=A0A644ZB44_9ZZZZ